MRLNTGSFSVTICSEYLNKHCFRDCVDEDDIADWDHFEELILHIYGRPIWTHIYVVYVANGHITHQFCFDKQK